MEFQHRHSHENLDEPFELSDDVYFETGTYNYTNIEAGIRTPSNKLLAIRAMFSAGQYYDGTIGPAELIIRPSANMKFSIDYQYSQIDIKTRDQYYKVQHHLVQFFI